MIYISFIKKEHFEYKKEEVKWIVTGFSMWSQNLVYAKEAIECNEKHFNSVVHV